MSLATKIADEIASQHSNGEAILVVVHYPDSDGKGTIEFSVRGMSPDLLEKIGLNLIERANLHKLSVSDLPQ
jgi:hypothetical protein